ncbi:MAG: MFS transporter, partial [Pseudomonadota bacterium]
MHHLPYWRLSGFYFFYFAFTGAFAPYWSLYLKSLAMSAFQIGALMSLLPVMRTFASAVWGVLADRSGQRMKIVRWSALLSLLSFCGVFLGDGFWWLFVVMGAMGFFWSASLPLVEAATMSHLGEHIGGYGRIRLWGSVGFILAVVGVGYVLDVMQITVLLWLVLGGKIGIAYFCQRIPESASSAHHADHLPVWHILRRPEVAALLIACFLMALAHGPYYTFFSIYLVDHGYSKSTVGWLWALGVICEIAIFIWL